MTKNSSQIRVGISGWSYPHWQGDFYPPGLKTTEELGFVSQRFPTVEINRTFYSLATPAAFRHWYQVAPPSFRFAVKGSRFITHNKKLAGVERPLANFFASGLLELKEKLGPILWQLSSDLKFDASRIEAFFELLPRDSAGLAALAQSHDLQGREVVTECSSDQEVRHVLEPRHPSLFVPDLAHLARRYGVALAFSHSSQWPYTEEATADFVYLRLHGPAALYSSAYTRFELARWANRIRSWATGSEPSDAIRISDIPLSLAARDVYVYFDNDTGGLAPRQAIELARLITEASEGDK